MITEFLDAMASDTTQRLGLLVIIAVGAFTWWSLARARADQKGVTEQMRTALEQLFWPAHSLLLARQSGRISEDEFHKRFVNLVTIHGHRARVFGRFSQELVENWLRKSEGGSANFLLAHTTYAIKDLERRLDNAWEPQRQLAFTVSWIVQTTWLIFCIGLIVLWTLWALLMVFSKQWSPWVVPATVVVLGSLVVAVEFGVARFRRRAMDKAMNAYLARLDQLAAPVPTVETSHQVSEANEA